MPPEDNKGKFISDRRSVKLEEIMKAGYIPFLGGRPKRDTVINTDDLIDLAVNLHKTETIEEFIQRSW